MPWQQVLMDGRRTLRFAAVYSSPMPSPFGPEKTAAIGAVIDFIKKNKDCGLRATHLGCLSVWAGSFAILAVYFLSNPGQVLITTRHVRYLFAQQN
jgi:hypothetical protein